MKLHLALLMVAGMTATIVTAAPSNEGGLCEQIAELADARKIQYDYESSIDINNDGEEEHVEYVEDGMVELARYRTRNGEPLELDSVIYEMNAGGFWQHLKLDGQIYRVQCVDPSCWAPSRVIRTGPDNVTQEVCRFRQQYNEQVVEGPSVCQSLIGDNAEKYIAGVKVAFDDKRIDRWASHPRRQLKLDFDNDGEQELLVQIDLENSSGKPCGYSYFDLLAPDGEGVQYGKQRDTLLKLQQMADPDTEIYPVSASRCYGNDAGWLKIDNSFVFETKYRGALPSALAQFHNVFRFEPDGARTTICQFSVSQETEVTSQ